MKQKTLEERTCIWKQLADMDTNGNYEGIDKCRACEHERIKKCYTPAYSLDRLMERR